MKTTKLIGLIIAAILAVALLGVFVVQSAQNTLADCVKQYDEHEANTLRDIVEGRSNSGSIEDVQMAISAVSEAYPELKSNENYKELMNELSMTENMIAEYRSNYNSQIKEYSRYVRKFPARFFLSLTGYETQEYTYLDYDAPVDAPQNLFGE